MDIIHYIELHILLLPILILPILLLLRKEEEKSTWKVFLGPPPELEVFRRSNRRPRVADQTIELQGTGWSPTMASQKSNFELE